jgi:hypothetical protein
MYERRKEMAISLSAIKKLILNSLSAQESKYMYVCPEVSYVAVNFECYKTWPFRFSDFVIRCTWRLANSLRLVKN